MSNHIRFAEIHIPIWPTNSIFMPWCSSFFPGFLRLIFTWNPNIPINNSFNSSQRLPERTWMWSACASKCAIHKSDICIVILGRVIFDVETKHADEFLLCLILSLPSSKTTMSMMVRIGSIFIFIWVGYEKPSSSYCVMWYFWWGCRRNLTLITLGSDFSSRMLPENPLPAAN